MAATGRHGSRRLLVQALYQYQLSEHSVAEIAAHAGRGMTVARFETVRFPTGTVQIWELTPHAPASAHVHRARVVDVVRRPTLQHGARILVRRVLAPLGAVS